jgi:hypothetical protein
MEITKRLNPKKCLFFYVFFFEFKFSVTSTLFLRAWRPIKICPDSLQLDLFVLTPHVCIGFE